MRHVPVLKKQIGLHSVAGIAVATVVLALTVVLAAAVTGAEESVVNVGNFIN
jgi:hypothetical protein